MKKWVAYLLAGAMVSSTTTAWASNYTDIGGHWAESAIMTWSDRNVLSGYNDLFRPNDIITRGEMAVILDRIMYYTQKQQNTFSDLDQAFYTEPILKAAKAGVLAETSGLVRPKEAMARQDAVVMLAKALGIAPVEGSTNFTDDAQISSQAKGYILGMKQNGYVSGSTDGAFHPNDPISRAEVVTLLSSSIDNVITENTTSASSNGKDVIINTPNVTLENTVIDKDLILAEGIGEGDVTLENITVKGSLIVRGGGIHTVKLKNSNVSNLSIEKKAAPVRVLTESSNVTKTNVTTSSILEGNFNTVTVSAPTDVTVRGAIETMEVSAKANLQTEGTATVKNVNITANGANTVVKGTGKVENVQIAGENVSVETPNTNVTVAQTVAQAKVNGQTVKGGTQTKTSSSAGNSSNKTSSSSSGNKPSSSGGSGSRPSGGGSSGGSSSGSTTQKKITIKNVESVSNSLVRVTLSDATKQPLKQSDFSIICTGGGSNMTILNVRTKDNKVYDITTTYYKDNTYNLQVTIDGKYVDKDFVVKYDCAELTSTETKRTSETAAEFYYVSDMPGTLYYGLVKNTPVLAAYENEAGEKVSARSVLPDGTQPSAEQLISSGTTSNMSVGLNKVNISGLEKDTAYTLYYVAVDVDDRITPVKQIAISAEAPAKPKPPTKPSNPSESESYEIESVVPHFNEKGGLWDENYWYTVTFDKAVKEKLELKNFELTCPAQANLHLGRVQKIDDKTYNVYSQVGYVPNDGNTLTMHVTFSNGTKVQNKFYFDTKVPDLKTSLSIERVGEDKINVKFKPDKDGVLYYKLYNNDDYDFDNIATKSPDDVYENGTPVELKASVYVTLENIPATAGQRFCYATELPSGQRQGNLVCGKLIETYPTATDPDNPDDTNPDNSPVKITEIKVVFVEGAYYDYQQIYLYFDKLMDIMEIPIDDENIQIVGFEDEKVMSSYISGEADPENPNADIKGMILNFNSPMSGSPTLIPEGTYEIILPLLPEGSGILSYEFQIGSDYQTPESEPEPNPEPEPTPDENVNPSNTVTKAVSNFIKPSNSTVSNSSSNSTEVKDNSNSTSNADVKDNSDNTSDTDTNDTSDSASDADTTDNTDSTNDTDTNDVADVKDDTDTNDVADVKDDTDTNDVADVKDDTDANDVADVKNDTDVNDVANTKEDTNSKENSDSSDTETEI
ncbi:S-layer homology domain-containing protein [Clostridium sp. MD294]|uniref:S-layer homology domain-containing protein n=1 Tax=Clostridium sp. MD294 TaxID=97138 RepID=UPI0002CC2C24|nr:S-layer homology domain-containing protein [Clostridium sp. MD294]NDO45660.1 hypothetical protein [Clostridium sp. MD294]USF30684.1 hypothetical protein C820_002127 [Clostridium sp. MD294]